MLDRYNYTCLIIRGWFLISDVIPDESSCSLISNYGTEMIFCEIYLIYIVFTIEYILVYPIFYQSKMKRHKAKIMILISWLAGILPVIFSGIMVTDIVDGTCIFQYHVPPAGKNPLLMCYFLSTYCIPLLIIMFCYIRMILVSMQLTYI